MKDSFIEDLDKATEHNNITNKSKFQVSKIVYQKLYFGTTMIKLEKIYI